VKPIVEPSDERPHVVARAEKVGRVVLDVRRQALREGDDQRLAVLVGQAETVAGDAVHELKLEDQVLHDHCDALLVALVDEVRPVQADRLVGCEPPRDEGERAGDLLERAFDLVVVPVGLDAYCHGLLPAARHRPRSTRGKPDWQCRGRMLTFKNAE